MLSYFLCAHKWGHRQQETNRRTIHPPLPGGRHIYIGKQIGQYVSCTMTVCVPATKKNPKRPCAVPPCTHFMLVRYQSGRPGVENKHTASHASALSFSLHSLQYELCVFAVAAVCFASIINGASNANICCPIYICCMSCIHESAHVRCACVRMCTEACAACVRPTAKSLCVCVCCVSLFLSMMDNATSLS